MERLHSGQGDVGERLEDLLGQRALEGQLGVGVALVLDLDREALGVAGDPGEVLVVVGRVDDEEIFLRAHAVDEHVVDEGRFGGHQGRVLDLAGGELGGVVRGQMLDIGQGVLAGDQDLAHVADVEEAGLRPHGHMFGDDAGIFDRHLPADEFDHLAAELLVELVEARLLHGSSFLH